MKVSGCKESFSLAQMDIKVGNLLLFCASRSAERHAAGKNFFTEIVSNAVICMEFFTDLHSSVCICPVYCLENEKRICSELLKFF